MPRHCRGTGRIVCVVAGLSGAEGVATTHLNERVGMEIIRREAADSHGLARAPIIALHVEVHKSPLEGGKRDARVGGGVFEGERHVDVRVVVDIDEPVDAAATVPAAGSFTWVVVGARRADDEVECRAVVASDGGVAHLLRPAIRAEPGEVVLRR